MEKSLIDLVKANHFSSDNKIKEKQIFNIINSRCTKNISLSLSDLLKEIDETLTSDYVKQRELNHMSMMNKSNILLTEIDVTISAVENLQNEGRNSIENFNELVTSIDNQYEEIHALEKRYENIENQEKLLTIISNIQGSLILDDFQLASEQIADFINHKHILSNSSSVRLGICDQLHKYHRIIKETLVKLFEEHLSVVNWPFISNGLLHTSSQLDTEKFDMIADKFSQCFLNLYRIELPDEIKDVENNTNSIINTDFMSLDAVCFPVCLLLRPLVKYFRIFFWADSKVNKLSKPEWYMTQVIQWISIHLTALDHMFTTPTLDCIDIKLEFIRALVIVVMEKVHKDLELTKNKDDLFFHLIDESLTMTVDLRKEFDYPENYPDPIDVVCFEEDTFDHWMVLEQRFALKQLDDVFLSTGAWRPLSTKCKRVECLESFLGLITSMKERIECVSDVSKRAKFCQVLLEVLENYRLRLLQITKNYGANTQRWYDVMNAVLCVKTFLRGWRLHQMFIEVQEYNEQTGKNTGHRKPSEERKVGSRTSSEVSSRNLTSTVSSSIYSNHIRHIELRQLENDSLFSNVLSLYQHVLDGLEAACVSVEFADLSARAESYVKLSWLLTEPTLGVSFSSLSPSASGLMLLLRDRLHELERALEPELFENVWQNLAHQLNKLLFKDVILSHRFTEAGAIQLDFDINRNLLPLFILYTKTPQRFFVDCLEASVLLNLKWGTILLIKELLRDALHISDSDHSSSTSSRTASPLRALNELGVYSLSPDMAEVVVKLRVSPTLL